MRRSITMRGLPEFTAELSLAKLGRIYERRDSTSKTEGAEAVTPEQFQFHWWTNVEFYKDLDSLDTGSGFGAAGCRNNPRRCCERDENTGRCHLWVAGCQLCP